MPTQFPNAAQIRAALSLLMWENEELASACGITAQTVSNIKRGATRPQPRVLKAIRNAFESSGIEFTEASGVRLKQDGVDILRGREGFLRLYQLIVERVAIHGGSICVNGVDEKLFLKYQGEFSKPYMERMTQLVKKRRDIQMKILVREGDKNFPAADYASYRWQNADAYSSNPFYVFADYLALISFHGENAPTCILIRSAAFANAYRKQFSVLWREARVPPSGQK